MNGDDRDGEAPTTEGGGLTSLINRMIDGDQQAGNAVAERLYQDWRAQARRRMKREGPGHVLETDALVNTSLRRMLQAGTPVNDRHHFRNLLQLYMNFSLSSYGRKRRRDSEDTTIDGKQLVDPAPSPEPLSPDVRRALDAVRGLSIATSSGGLGWRTRSKRVEASPEFVLRAGTGARPFAVPLRAPRFGATARTRHCSLVASALVPAAQRWPAASQYIARSTTICAGASPRLSTIAPNRRPAASGKKPPTGTLKRLRAGSPT
jgi:DNA-directed RNA polymerase specialized sigma24 family protein